MPHRTLARRRVLAVVIVAVLGTTTPTTLGLGRRRNGYFKLLLVVRRLAVLPKAKLPKNLYTEGVSLASTVR